MDKNTQNNIDFQNIQKTQKKTSKKIVILIVAGLFLVIGGAAFGALYTEMWNPSWDPFLEEEIIIENNSEKQDGNSEEQNTTVEQKLANQYTHPVDGFYIEYPDGATFTPNVAGGVGVKQSDSNTETTLTEVESDGKWYFSVSFTPSDWSLQPARLGDIEDSSYAQTNFAGVPDALKFEEVVDEGIFVEIIFDFQEKHYQVTYFGEQQYSDILKDIALSFKPGQNSVQEIGSYYQSIIDSKQKGDIRFYDIAVKNTLEKGTLPVTESILRIDRETGLPAELEGVLDFSGEAPTPPTRAPSSFYGFKYDGENYELTAALDNKYDPECIVEGNFCIYKVVNGEVVSTK